MPTGLASVKVAGLPALDQTACGRIATPATCCRFMYCEVGNVSVTVSPAEVTLEMFRPPRLIAAFFFIRL